MPRPPRRATRLDVLLKHDLERVAVEEHRFEHGAAGEDAFAPVSLSAGEDEGYVMAFAHDLDGSRTDLVILGAPKLMSTTISDEPHAPRRGLLRMAIHRETRTSPLGASPGRGVEHFARAPLCQIAAAVCMEARVRGCEHRKG